MDRRETQQPARIPGGPAALLGGVVKGAVTITRLPRRTVETGRQVVADASTAIDQGRDLATRALLLVGMVEALVADIAVTAARAAVVVSKAEAVAANAGAVVVVADTQLLRTQELLDVFAPPLVRLQPVLDRAAEVVEPRHVQAVARLLDLTPEVIDLIGPALTNLGDLTPELHQLAERFEAIGQIVEGIPGAGLFKRRGASEDDETP